MNNGIDNDKYGMDVSAFEARHADELMDEPLVEVHSRVGDIPEDHEVKLVQCPFETNIAAEDVDLPMCPRAEKCTLVGYMDLCTVPHVHNFESPGTHIEHKPVTKSDGFSLELALSRVHKATRGVRHMKRDGLIIVAPKRSKYKSVKAAKTGAVNTKTRAEAYSVYDFNTTPPAVEKAEVVMTRAERFEVADRRETKRIQFIQDCRDFKIDAMLATA